MSIRFAARLWLVAGLVALLGPAVALAQVKLEHKQVEGATYAGSVDISTKQTMSILGMNQESSSQNNIVVRTKNGKREADGTLRSESKVEALQAQIKAPGLGEISFDSAKPDKAPDSPLTPIFKASAAGSWTTVYGKDGKVTAVEGRDKSYESLDPALRERVKSQYAPEYLKEVANKQLERIPSKPLNVGDSWETVEPMKIDAAQTLTFTRKYTYQGEVEKDGKKVDSIKVVSTAVKLDIDGNAGLPLKLVKSNLKIKDSSGTIYFDRNLGRVVGESQKSQIVGPLTLGVAGQEIDAELDLTLETSAMDRN